MSNYLGFLEKAFLSVTHYLETLYLSWYSILNQLGFNHKEKHYELWDKGCGIVTGPWCCRRCWRKWRSRKESGVSEAEASTWEASTSNHEKVLEVENSWGHCRELGFPGFLGDHQVLGVGLRLLLFHMVISQEEEWGVGYSRAQASRILLAPLGLPRLHITFQENESCFAYFLCKSVFWPTLTLNHPGQHHLREEDPA